MRRLRTTVTGVAAALAMSVCAGATPGGDSFALRGAVIAGGGGSSRSAQECFALEATVAENAAGVSAAGEFVLRAGFWAGAGALRRDSVFHDRFEECE